MEIEETKNRDKKVIKVDFANVIDVNEVDQILLALRKHSLEYLDLACQFS